MTAKSTSKERVDSLRGKEVPIDYFLFTCLERERMTKHPDMSGPAFRHWPPLDKIPKRGDEEPHMPEEIRGQSMEQIVGGICKWYALEHPAMTDTRMMEFETLSDIVPPFVMFTHDLATAVYLKTDQQLPPHNAQATEDVPVDPAATAFWENLRKNLRQTFPKYGAYFEAYLEWAFSAEITEEFEIGSRPPVGRYAPSMRFRSSTGSGPGRSSGGGSGGGGRGNFDRGDRSSGRSGPPRGPRPQEHQPAHDEDPEDENRGNRRDTYVPGGGEGPRGRPPRDFGGDRPPRDFGGDRPPRGPRGDREGRGPRDGGRRGHHSDRGRSEELEQAAVAEVHEAIDQLKGNKTLQEVALRPANSFYRRIQHQVAVEAGFHSNSIGEGPERAVRVSKAPPADQAADE